MAKFIYNNAKNFNTGYIPFKLNCEYYSRISFEDKTNCYLKSCFTNILVKKLKELIKNCYQNLLNI